jgi:hypothetical protein
MRCDYGCLITISRLAMSESANNFSVYDYDVQDEACLNTIGTHLGHTYFLYSNL